MSDILDRLHRMFFRVVSLLPTSVQGRFLRHYFEWVHHLPDPWRYDTEPYEIDKYEMTLRHVPHRAYRRVLDVGCSEGAFTRRLARAYPGAECWGVDVSDRAVTRAAAKAAGAARFVALDFLNEDPDGTFDLVICAETLYYVGRDERLRLAYGRLRSFMAPGAVLVLVHEWPEARRLYRHLDDNPFFRRVSEHPYEHPVRSYAVTVYERVEPASRDRAALVRAPRTDPMTRLDTGAPAPGLGGRQGPAFSAMTQGRRRDHSRSRMRPFRTLLLAAVLATGTAAAGRPVVDELPLPSAFDAHTLQDRYELHAWSGRQFLAWSRRGDGQAIEVVGDLANARTVIVYVPGSGQSLASFDDSAESTGRAARALYDEAAALGPGTAVIGWLGYDPPDLVNPEIATIWPADRGARRLRPFLSLLPRHVRLSLVCHSYGSVVCARAVAGSPVRDLIVTGSPGLGVRRASDLHTSARIWAALGRGDDVFRSGLLIGPFGFGTDPVSAEFGARVVDGGDAQHHTYLRPGTRTLTEITHIAVRGRERAA
ncbi:alpha/beta hydrolase [Nonomuraea recticatena]|uniref:Methyltransferase domain-containing protein n=1 Tax=Nonomuraea recticatena TaxID=46178 RepID=A0ABN3TDS3_9ACTN